MKIPRIPLYQQLMEDIKTSLAEGKYLPDEKSLLSRSFLNCTMSAASPCGGPLKSCAPRGYLVKKQGKGTYVSQPKVMRKIAQNGDVMGFFGSVPRLRYGTRRPGHQHPALPCALRRSALFGLEPHSDVIYLQRVRTADSEPVMLENNFSRLTAVSGPAGRL